jgi:hypothetical protein
LLLAFPIAKKQPILANLALGLGDFVAASPARPHHLGQSGLVHTFSIAEISLSLLDKPFLLVEEVSTLPTVDLNK